MANHAEEDVEKLRQEAQRLYEFLQEHNEGRRASKYHRMLGYAMGSFEVALKWHDLEEAQQHLNYMAVEAEFFAT
ncbi:hypothetical protein [Streptomyces hundungensis]|uniref:hypothetical protein n=1 Tax=Streptomyces hundungensis TaxID=1077946 RepID=UPI0033C3C545